MSKKRRTYDVFVGNLPPHVTEKSLSPLFTELGEVNSITIRSGRRHDGPRTAYVQYLCEPDADTAVEKLNGCCFEGHCLMVSRFSKDKRTEVATREAPHHNAPQGTTRSSLTINELYAAIGKTSSPRLPLVGPRTQLPSSTAASNAEETLLVCHIKDVTSFYGQRLTDVPRVAELNKELEEFCRSSPRLCLETPEFEKLYGCQFSEDKAWYRCKVLKQLDNSQSFVQYVDFGNCEGVQSSEMVALRGDLATDAPLAVCYRLDGLFGIRRDDEPALYAQAVQKIGEMVRDQCVCVQMKRATAAGMHFLVRCRLERTGVDLGDELVRLGYAKVAGPFSGPHVPNGGGGPPTYGASGRGGRPPGPPPGWHLQGHPWGSRPTWGTRPPRPYVDRSGVYLGQGSEGPRERGGGYPATTRATHPAQQSHQHHGKGASREAAGGVVHIAKAEKRVKQSQNPQASAAQSPPALGEVAAQKERLSARLQEQEAKIKALGQEVVELKAVRTENDFLHRMSRVLKLMEKARQQRDQVSADPARADALQRAVAALTACREAARTFLNTREVEDSLARFRRAQDNVRACRDKAAVGALVEERNDARSCLELSLGRFVAQADKLPVHADQESSTLSPELSAGAGNAATVLLGQEALQDLEHVFQPFLDNAAMPPDQDAPSLEDLYAQHELNKKAMETEFQAKRHETDIAEGHLREALETLREALSLSSAKQPLKGNFSLPFLEACLSNLQHSISSEVEACNLVGSSRHAALSLLCHKLRRELGDALERILNVAKERTRCAVLLHSLQPFSEDNTPNEGVADEDVADYARDPVSEWERVEGMVSTLTEKRRAVRQLKSQLRHCLVDMEDIESRDGAEWKEAAEAVNNLREKVLSAFAEEDALLRGLMKLQEEHFPELAVLYPELEIEAYSRYKGLVKSSWELCAFCTTEERQDPLMGSWFRATNGDKQVLIKECVVDTEEIREELLSRAVEWSQLSSEHLLPLQAAFISKDGRRVYLLVPCTRGHSLATWDCPITSTLLGDVLGAILQGLAALHAAGRAHGSVHPAAVLVPEGGDEKVLLDLPNFPASLGRLEAGRCLPLNGLELGAPELLAGESTGPTPEGDMYALGCLLLWMCFPNVRFQPTTSGTPSLSALSSPRLGDSAFSLAKELLNSDPKARPTAAQVLESKSFLNLVKTRTSEEAALSKELSVNEGADEMLLDTTGGSSVVACALGSDDMVEEETRAREDSGEKEVLQSSEGAVEVQHPSTKEAEEISEGTGDEILSTAGDAERQQVIEKDAGTLVNEDNHIMPVTDDDVDVPVSLAGGTSNVPPPSSNVSEGSDCELSYTGRTTSTGDSLDDQFFAGPDDDANKVSVRVADTDDYGAGDATAFCKQDLFYDAKESSSAVPAEKIAAVGSEDVSRGGGDAALALGDLVRESHVAGSSESSDDAPDYVALKVTPARPRSRLLVKLEMLQSEGKGTEAVEEASMATNKDPAEASSARQGSTDSN